MPGCPTTVTLEKLIGSSTVVMANRPVALWSTGVMVWGVLNESGRLSGSIRIRIRLWPNFVSAECTPSPRAEVLDGPVAAKSSCRGGGWRRPSRVPPVRVSLRAVRGARRRKRPSSGRDTTSHGIIRDLVALRSPTNFLRNHATRRCTFVIWPLSPTNFSAIAWPSGLSSGRGGGTGCACNVVNKRSAGLALGKLFKLPLQPVLGGMGERRQRPASP